MNVLIACEESQEVCKAFRARGHRAFSCDIQDCSGGHPEWHIKADVIPLLNGSCAFETVDTHIHTQSGPWDLLIAHPPCTYLSAASAVRLYDAEHNIKDRGRDLCGWEARKFFYEIWDSCAPRLCIENPVPLSRYALPRYTQIIQPYEFGDPWKKRTCLWLRGLNQLEPTNIVDPIGYWIGAHGHDKAKKGLIKGFRDQKTRSKTFPGIARAMAEQWGNMITKSNADRIRELQKVVDSYRKAEEQGRLVILPCKVGDKVLDKIADYIFTIQKVELGHKAGTLFRCGNPGTDDYMAFYDFEIGKNFDVLGREEAEAAMDGGQD